MRQWGRVRVWLRLKRQYVNTETRTLDGTSGYCIFPLRISSLLYQLFTDKLADTGRLVRSGCFGGQADVNSLPQQIKAQVVANSICCRQVLRHSLHIIYKPLSGLGGWYSVTKVLKSVLYHWNLPQFVIIRD